MAIFNSYVKLPEGTYWWVGLTPLLTKHCFPRPSMKSYWQDRGPRHFPRRISKDVPIEKMKKPVTPKKWLLAVLSLFSFVKYILEVSNIWGYTCHPVMDFHDLVRPLVKQPLVTRIQTMTSFIIKQTCCYRAFWRNPSFFINQPMGIWDISGNAYTE
jgi:hypothetical protein